MHHGKLWRNFWACVKEGDKKMCAKRFIFAPAFADFPSTSTAAQPFRLGGSLPAA
jgi:hypothetical protein